jgi:hypothetical protein
MPAPTSTGRFTKQYSGCPHDRAIKPTEPGVPRRARNAPSGSSCRDLARVDLPAAERSQRPAGAAVLNGRGPRLDRQADYIAVLSSHDRRGVPRRLATRNA